MFLGLSIAFFMAFLVISLKTILLVLVSSNFNVLKRCQAMASPSRSSSLASHTVLDFFTKSFKSLTIFFLSSLTIYFGLKSLSILTPSSLDGRSTIWPKQEETLKSLPKNLSIVLAFAGDSTITRFSSIFNN